MAPFLLALIAAAQPAPPPASGIGRTAWLFATVGHSEWCPAGSVRLDVRTGAYELTPRASRHVCNLAGLERPAIKGRLAGDRLAGIRTAFLRATSEGLESEICREGKKPDEIVITNAGPGILVATNGRASMAAPDDRSCWSRAARDLEQQLEEAFRDYHQR